MAANSVSNNRRLCWEKVLQTVPLFRMTQVFIPKQNMDAYLALYALFSSLEQLCWLADSPEVMNHNIEWWGNELLALNSAHPVIQLLEQSGARERLPESQLTGLVRAAAMSLDSDPPVGNEDFRQLCIHQYRYRTLLEFSLCTERSGSTDVNEEWAAIGGLLQFIRALVNKPASASWWLPMDVLARYQIQRQELLEDAAKRDKVLGELIRAAEHWNQPIDNNSSGTDFDIGHSDEHQSKTPAVNHWSHRHVFVFNLLQAKKLKNLGKLDPGEVIGSMNRVGPGDLFAAWRLAREFAKSNHGWAQGIGHR